MYISTVAHHPCVIIAVIALGASVCIVIPLTTWNLPDFSDPRLGFESRGTALSQRLTTWKNLLKATRSSGPLTSNPIEYAAKKVTISENSTQNNQRKQKRKNMTVTGGVKERSKSRSGGADNKKDKKRKKANDAVNATLHEHEHVSENGFFCGEPNPNYARVVFRKVDGGSLFNLRSILSMCHLQSKLRDLGHFKSICEKVFPGRCCMGWSLPNYIALLSNRTSCFSLTEEDVSQVLHLLTSCWLNYNNMSLHGCSGHCTGVASCSQHNAVYNMLHYILDNKFLSHWDNNTFLSYSMLFLPIARSSASLNYYMNLQMETLHYNDVEIFALDFGLKEVMFEKCLIQDTLLISFGGMVVVMLMWIYTGSMFVTFMAILCIVFSLGISYFIYTVIFGLEFFPFMNLLVSAVVVGIGADDVFIFCKMWNCTKSLEVSNMEELVRETLKESALSMFATSFTSAAAFYASYISSITAIRCFSIFAGTTILVNFLFMMTWIPASAVLAENLCSNPFSKCSVRLLSLTETLLKTLFQMKNCAVLKQFVTSSVVRLANVWVLVFAVLAAASVVAVFYSPGLQLPNSKNFQLFSSSNLFEKYEMNIRNRFDFESSEGGESIDQLPLYFVWGIKPVDNGDYLNPFSKGHLEYDMSFNVAHPESQVWLLRFCEELRNQSFYQESPGLLPFNCFIETFVSWMSRRCVDVVYNVSLEPCCESSLFPYEEDTFTACLMEAVHALHRTPRTYFVPGSAGPYFVKETKRLQVVVVEYDSSHLFSVSFTEMDRFYNHVETWTLSKLKTAPEGMKNGWFITQLDFYELQRTISQGTITAILVAMGISFIIMFAITLNILISIYAIITLTFIIFGTVSILILLGWKLNVLESVTVTVAIGLSVDFTLHYGIAYKMCPTSLRESGVRYSVSKMISPTAMAAATTVTAGLFMLLSNVLAYIQIGTFLIVIMVISWLVSTLFFLSLLKIAGPQRGFGQYSYRDFLHYMKLYSVNHDAVFYTGVPLEQRDAEFRES